MYSTRASPTDILARKSARRTKVRGLCRRAERAARAARRGRQADCRGAARAAGHADPRAEVGEEVCVGVGVRVRVVPVEFKLILSVLHTLHVCHNPSLY